MPTKEPLNGQSSVHDEREMLKYIAALAGGGPLLRKLFTPQCIRWLDIHLAGCADVDLLRRMWNEQDKVRKLELERDGFISTIRAQTEAMEKDAIRITELSGIASGHAYNLGVARSEIDRLTKLADSSGPMRWYDASMLALGEILKERKAEIDALQACLDDETERSNQKTERIEELLVELNAANASRDMWKKLALERYNAIREMVRRAKEALAQGTE